MSGGRPRVFVARRLPGRALERLAALVDLDCWEGDGPPPRSELIARARDAVGLVPLLTDRVDAELLDQCRSLVVVSSMGVGYDHVDVAELTRRKIPLGNTPEVLTEATADLAFALVLAMARRLVEARAAVLEGRWGPWDPSFLLGRELNGSMLGIVGLGRIGTAMARRARAFSMEVIAWTRTSRDVQGVRLVGFDELLARSEFVSLHVPLSAETFHLIGEREFEVMRDDAVLINTARGAIVDQKALARALANGSIAAAGLDVCEIEPIALDDPLLGLSNCLVLPHIGSATETTRARMADLVVDNLLAGLAGERLPHCVNPEVYESQD